MRSRRYTWRTFVFDVIVGTMLAVILSISYCQDVIDDWKEERWKLSSWNYHRSFRNKSPTFNRSSLGRKNPVAPSNSASRKFKDLSCL